MTERTPIAITMGDACGIGPEVVLKACAALAANASQPEAGPSFDGSRCVVFGDPAILEREARSLGLPLEVVAAGDVAGALQAAAAWVRTAAGAQAAGAGSKRALPVVACSMLPDDLATGRIDARAGRAAHAAIDRAARAALAGDVRAVVTAPIHKEALQQAGIAHPGHTELLAEIAGGADVRMMLANDELRTVLVTIHEPLRRVAELVTRKRVLETILIAATALRRLGIDRPRIAVAGLNPHAGEGGLMGREDLDEIAPAIADALAGGVDASGPWPGDTIFMRARGFAEFDAVVAMYHDQGLIPIKYLGLDTGVNATIGLPFVRTSVDHGTAFDIAGRGVADARSLLAAIRLAALMSPST
jgi:4-hydroxythreonine-4-phosphate dehydrogenase